MNIENDVIKTRIWSVEKILQVLLAGHGTETNMEEVAESAEILYKYVTKE